MKKWIFCVLLTGHSPVAHAWGFYAHRMINQYAVFLLPPDMLVFYKPNIQFLREHAVDPDKRRYVVAAEGPRHFIDIDHYGLYPFPDLPHDWEEAINRYSEDSLREYGIVPWWIPVTLRRLTSAFEKKDAAAILKYSADIGHYIADAHVPLHASSNHNGQLTRQQGIHGFWESRIPELLAESQFDFFIGKANYIARPSSFVWSRVLESAAAADTVLLTEARLNAHTSPDRKYAFERRNGKLTRQYSRQYSIAYNRLLNNMVERRMRQSIYAVASFWYTAWVNAGQPDLSQLSAHPFNEEDRKSFDELNQAWRNGKLIGRSCE